MRIIAAILVAGVLIAAGGCDQPNRVLASLPNPAFNAQDNLVNRPDKAWLERQQPRGQERQPQPASPGNRSEPSWAHFTGRANTWRYIVVHHSATPNGSAAAFDRSHRQRGWENGLGYHFVIGNGSGSGDGQIEVGPRWTQQIQGAHAKTSDQRFNNHGIGICLVGDFNRTYPTRAQMASLKQLVQYFSGRYHIPASRIYGHRHAVASVHEGGTDCPGAHLDINIIRNWAQQNSLASDQ